MKEAPHILTADEKDLVQDWANKISKGEVQEFYIAIKTEKGNEACYASEGGTKLANRLNRARR